MLLVKLRVTHTIESGFDHSLQLSHIFVPCALSFASIAGVCVQLHIDTLPRETKRLSGELSQEAYLTSWMGHFGTETIHSLLDRFSLSNSGSTLNLTNTLLGVKFGPFLHESSNGCWSAVVTDLCIIHSYCLTPHLPEYERTLSLLGRLTMSYFPSNEIPLLFVSEDGPFVC